MASRNLEDLAGIFRPRVEDWLDDCKSEGLDILVYCTLRPLEEQAKLYKIGRTVKGEGVTANRPMGRKVTNAKPGSSAHNYGMAVDFVPLVGGKAQWSNKKLYQRAIDLAKQRNIGSLVNDPDFPEMAHLQLPYWKEYK
jgi:peptidoglycan L-alanyl-D-glutamate endopeptidase CwlK